MFFVVNRRRMAILAFAVALFVYCLDIAFRSHNAVSRQNTEPNKHVTVHRREAAEQQAIFELLLQKQALLNESHSRSSTSRDQIVPSQQTTLSKRASPIVNDTPTLFRARCKGEAALARISAAGLSKDANTDVSALTNTGWSAVDFDDEFEDDKLNTVFPNIGKGTSWIALNQNADYTDSTGVKRPSTAASFESIFNAREGYFIAVSNFSPLNKLSSAHLSTPVADLIPRLPHYNRWSDVVWIQWRSACHAAGADPGNLKFIIRNKIVTENALRIMEQVVDPRLPALGLDAPWPGKVFRPGEAGFTALMGTDHANGISWMLHDHRNRISKRVAKITVFTLNKDYFLRFDFT